MSKIDWYGTEGFRPSLKVCKGCRCFDNKGNKGYCKQYKNNIYHLSVCLNPQFFDSLFSFVPKQAKLKKSVSKQSKITNFLR